MIIVTQSFAARDGFGVPGDGEFTSPGHANHMVDVSVLSLLFIVSLTLSVSLSELSNMPTSYAQGHCDLKQVTDYFPSPFFLFDDGGS